MKQVAIFGAGKFGKMAHKAYGERAVCFVDNNSELIGKCIDGLPVIDIGQLTKEQEKYDIVIATKYSDSVINQFHSVGIHRYEIYQPDVLAYYPTKELIYNPYTEDNGYIQYSENANDFKIKEIERIVDELYEEPKLFNHIEIETINRCNGNCDFCPVSGRHDTREYKVMDRTLFEHIIDQLSEMEYNGKIALFSNNEPFLDPDIVDKHRYAREKLPYARMHLFTNGTLLNLEKFLAIMKYLDELIIDNYQQELQLIKPCKEIQQYCEKNPELKERVTIVLRKPNEILSSRGGDAPNKKEVTSYANAKCVLPFKQMIIRPDGKVSLCCNDPLGKNTLGDASEDSLIDIWYNDKFRMVRKCLHEGRGHWKHCEFCDAFGIG